jgi:ribose 5-phosphate isomerase A
VTDRESLKREAALRAVALVESGMVVGLGTGSTAWYAVEALGARLRAGDLTNVVGVATSRATEVQAEALGIPLGPLEPHGVDLAIDGMDELDSQLDAIKGLGGALTREKLVALQAKTFVLIGDASKRVSYLGEKAPVPVEAIPFAQRVVAAELAALGCTPMLRRDEHGEPLVTDNGNVIFDCHFDAPFEAGEVARACKAMSGVVEHGLFLGMADVAFVASDAGVLELTR